MKKILPPFLNIIKEVTGDPSYSMFNLSLKEDWNSTKKFCYSLHGELHTHADVDESHDAGGSKNWLLRKSVFIAYIVAMQPNHHQTSKNKDRI